MVRLHQPMMMTTNTAACGGWRLGFAKIHAASFHAPNAVAANQATPARPNRPAAVTPIHPRPNTSRPLTGLYKHPSAPQVVNKPMIYAIVAYAGGQRLFHHEGEFCVSIMHYRHFLVTAEYKYEMKTPR